MNDKKQRLTILIISILVLVIGMSYAYYSAVVQGTGNANAEASGKTATIGEVEFNGTKTFVTTLIDEIYPGFIGIQEFTISPYKDGTGIYEVDLQAGVPEAFGDDIRISVYKTSDKTNNNVTRTEGELTINNNQYTKQDILTINGVPEKVYEGILKTTNLEVVEQLRFTILNNAFTTPSVTPDGYYTYYAVYEYLDNGDQNNQQGLDFEGKFTVRYVTDNEYNAASYITSLVADASKGSINVIDNGTDASGCTNTLAYDDYGNLRYVGTNPCNYITFNGEVPEAVGAKYEIHVKGTAGTGSDTLEDCNQKITFVNLMYGDIVSCSLDETTGKYMETVDGFLSNAGQFDSKSDCEASNLYTQGTQSASTTVSCELRESDAYKNGWRIIGVVDGKLKIIRNNKIGDYSWDTSEQTVNGGKGINQWGESGTYTGADLMKLLNPGYEDNTDSTYSCVYNETTKQDDCELVNNSILINNSLYWNKTSGKCYNNNYNQSVDCDFSETGLTSGAKNMIDNHHWYLGAINSQGLNNANAKTTFYENERKNQTGKICTSGDGCNDNVIRTTKWNGYVGLAYGSDIIYSNGGVNRITCIENSSAINSESPGCNNTWLKGDIFTMPGENMNFYSNGLISPTYSSNSATGALNTLGAIGAAFMESMPTSSGTPILPTVYLKSNVKITGGDGTPTNPFIVSQ